MGLLGQTGLVGELEASHQNDREDQEAGRVETLERSAGRCDCSFRERYKIRGICGELVELLGKRESKSRSKIALAHIESNLRTRAELPNAAHDMPCREKKTRTICIVLTGLLVVGSHLGRIVFMVRVEICVAYAFTFTSWNKL